MGLPLSSKGSGKSSNSTKKYVGGQLVSGGSSGGTSANTGSASSGSGSTSGSAMNDANTNYQKIINEAVAKGDYTTAAKAENLRNAKIADMNASGTNTANYGTTNNYSQYYKPTNFSGSANAVTTYDSEQSDIRAQMNANSDAWWTALGDDAAALEAANRALASQLGGNVSWDQNTGYWSGAAETPVETGEKPTFSYSAGQPTFSSNYNSQIDALLNRILSREDFSYNPEEDQLFQYYQKMYQREGERAMNDTLASVAAGAGGMNSYAVTAAQQANDYYNSQMTDKIPELYQMAYQMYLDDKASMVEDLGLLQQMDDTEYNRYRDTMSDWRDDRNFAYNMYRDDMSDYQWGTEFNYNASRDQIADQRYDQEWEYNVGRDQIADSRYEDETAYDRATYESETARAWALDLIASGVELDAATLQAAGLTSAQAKQMIAEAQTASARRPSSGETPSKTADTDVYQAMFDAGIKSEADAYAWLSDNGYKSATTYAKYYMEKYDNGDFDVDERGDAYSESVKALGAGKISASELKEISSYKGIVDNGNGGIEWANGWSADNFEEKLAQKRAMKELIDHGVLPMFG